MTREQVKSLLPVIIAFAEGKTIEALGCYGEWVEVNYPNFDGNPKNYRIKSEVKCRPFKNAEECWQEMRNHSPFGWVSFKGEENSYIQCQGIEDRGILYNSDTWTFEYMLSDFTFIDGSPFGVKEEGECL